MLPPKQQLCECQAKIDLHVSFRFTPLFDDPRYVVEEAKQIFLVYAVDELRDKVECNCKPAQD